jgi:uncharacterized protein YkwD
LSIIPRSLVHHRRSSPPPSARLAAACGRVLRPLSRLLTGRRVLPVLVGVLAVTGIVLLVPLMAAGRGGLSTAESGGTSTAGTSAPRSGVVTMGVDGEPLAPGTAVPGAPGTTAGGPSAGAAPGTTPGTTPGTAPRTAPGTAPGATPHEAPGTTGGTTPEAPAAGSSTAGAPSATESAPGPSSSPSAGSSSEGSPAAGSPSAGSPSAGSPSAGPASAGSSSEGRSTAAPAPTQTSTPAAPAPVARTSAPATSGTEATVLALVNDARAAAGCGAVRADPALAAVARTHSADMRDRGFFAHDNPDGLSPFDRAEAAGITSARAENIAQGQDDASAVMQAWLDSPGHRANILNCSLSTLGVGVAEGAGGPWWTQLFGA